MKDYITLEELKVKAKELAKEYNEYTEKGLMYFAENSIEHLNAVRYVISLIEN